MTRNELIELGKRIVSGEVSEIETNELIELFDRNVPHPKGVNLFFWPDNYNARTTIMSEYNPSIEEVVDECLAYKPIIL